MISLHRLVQVAFLERNFEPGSPDLQKLFEEVSTVLHHEFPQSKSTSYWGRWQACAKYLPHGLSLIRFYRKQSVFKPRLHASKDALWLWIDCSWYLYESGDFQESVALLETATNACDDTSGLQYAYLQSHISCSYFELHDVEKAKEAIEMAVSIREKLLPEDDLDRVNGVSNHGLILLSECEFEKALDVFKHCAKIRGEIVQKGKTKIDYLAASHLHMAMAYVQMGKLDEADRALDKTEELIRHDYEYLKSL